MARLAQAHGASRDCLGGALFGFLGGAATADGADADEDGAGTGAGTGTGTGAAGTGGLVLFQIFSGLFTVLSESGFNTIFVSLLLAF